jgi:protein O-GlcNAc transferase
MHAAPMTQAPTLQDAHAREQAGDLIGADAIYRALHVPAAPNPGLLVAWSRLRRRLGDQQSAAAMLNDANRAGGGPAVLVDMAGLLLDQNRPNDATPLLRQAAQSGRSPALDFEVARWEAANGRHDQAAALFRGLVKHDGRQLAPRLGYARAMAAQNRAADAEAAYTALLNRDPTMRPALAELANLFAMRNRFQEALALFDRLAATGADVTGELSRLCLALMLTCDWRNREALLDRLAARLDRPEPCLLEALPVLAGRDDPTLHRKLGDRFAGALRTLSAQREHPAPRPVGPADRRLRIGYLAGDFSGLVTSQLLAGVMEAHDRENFEVTAYDYSVEDNSPIRARIKAAFEHWVDIAQEGPITAAQRIAADEIDILVDLKGYTERTRSEIVALRPAPVQVGFFGYAGTQGGDWLDYTIADATVLPESEYPNWTEQPVLLRASSVPNDRSRPLPEPNTDRAGEGLLAGGIVFACFTNPFKISPEIFAAWMEILRAVPDSVLWIFQGNDLMPANLRAAAEAQGVAPGRILFAAAVPLEDHIARHGCADIFLDTHPFSAHTAASDALWAGLPVVTCMGRSVASRAGASVVRAAGIPELVANSLADYVALAISLAQDSERRADVRARLLAGRETSALFDAAAFARGLEQAYTIMAYRARAGEPPAPIILS